MFDIPNVMSDQIGFSTGRNVDGTLKAPSELADVDSEDDTATVLMFLHPEGVEDDDETDDVNEGELSGLDGMLSSTQKDTVVIRGSIAFGDDAVLPLDSLDIQVTVDVGPSGDEDPGRTGYGGIPRFESDESAAFTVIDVESSQTILVLPYGLSDGRFDTGIAISNMNTGDDQAGAITFMIFHGGEEGTKYTTDIDAPGAGLTNGELEAGTTYTVLLSEILDKAGVDITELPNGFRGYVEITTDFTDADGIAYISDWAAFSATATLEEKD